MAACYICTARKQSEPYAVMSNLRVLNTEAQNTFLHTDFSLEVAALTSMAAIGVNVA